MKNQTVKIYGLFIRHLSPFYSAGRILLEVREDKNMTNQLINVTETRFSNSLNKRRAIPRGYWTIWHIGAGIGLLGGTLILACAVFITIFQYSYGETPHGVWLYLVVLPLWILGAHCLDEVEEIEKARSIVTGTE
jgi:hypothetical protein